MAFPLSYFLTSIRSWVFRMHLPFKKVETSVECPTPPGWLPPTFFRRRIFFTASKKGKDPSFPSSLLRMTHPSFHPESDFFVQLVKSFRGKPIPGPKTQAIDQKCLSRVSNALFLFYKPTFSRLAPFSTAGISFKSLFSHCGTDLG